MIISRPKTKKIRKLLKLFLSIDKRLYTAWKATAVVIAYKKVVIFRIFLTIKMPPINPAVPMCIIAISAKNCGAGDVLVAEIRANSNKKNPRPIKSAFASFDFSGGKTLKRLKIIIYFRTSSIQAAAIMNCGTMKN